MEWNNGTIFRVFINSGDQTTIDCKVDIAQQDLNNDVFIGIENWVLKPAIETAGQQIIWAARKYVQLESVQLTPYIDYTSQNAGTDEFNRNNSRNTSIFARLPILLGNATDIASLTTFGNDRVLNKDSILYEMRNNPNALANGRLRINLLDEDGNALTDILSFACTLVIYKPSNNYN